MFTRTPRHPHSSANEDRYPQRSGDGLTRVARSRNNILTGGRGNDRTQQAWIYCVAAWFKCKRDEMIGPGLAGLASRRQFIQSCFIGLLQVADQ